MTAVMTVVIAFCGGFLTAVLAMTVLTFLSKDPRFSLHFEDDRLTVRVRGGRLLRLCRADIIVTNVYTGGTAGLENVRFDSREGAVLTVGDIGCGVLRAKITRLKWRCGFSPISRQSTPDCTAALLVMPHEKPCALSGSHLISGRTARDSAAEGVRDYRRGERLSDIHMKLSAKAGHYMIRERVPESEGVTVAFACEEGFAYENAAALLGVVNACIANGVPCYVRSGGIDAGVSTHGDIEPMFYTLFTGCGSVLPDGCGLAVTHGEVGLCS